MPNSQPSVTRIRRLRCTRLWSGIAAAAVFASMCGASVAQTSDNAEVVERESGVVVSDIRIEGNQTIPESVILQKIQSQPQREVTERLIREDKRSLMSTRWFFSVSERIDESPDGLILVFVVHERPIVQRVEFRGNRKVKKKHLEAWTGLKIGSPYDHLANREARNRIEEEYREKGYYFVKVELVKGSQPGEREVIFQITEGPKVQVTQRTFEGNRFWNDGDLRKNLISKERILIFGGIYNPDTLPADIEAVKQFYRNVGFFDVDVTAVPLFSKDRAHVNLHFKIQEGMQYAVREIRYQGNSIVSTQRLKSGSKLQPGDKFNSYPLSKDVQRMLGYYGDMGHYFASVNPVPQFTETKGIVDLVVEIDEDRPRYIRDINVSYGGDNPHTKQTVVLDRIQMQPGDLADPKRVRRGRSRLNGSGLFEPGIAFDVTPVEPESSFASVSRTWRGQSPGNSPDDWTTRFTFEAHRAADDSVLEWRATSLGSDLRPELQDIPVDEEDSAPEQEEPPEPNAALRLLPNTPGLELTHSVHTITAAPPVSGHAFGRRSTTSSETPIAPHNRPFQAVLSPNSIVMSEFAGFRMIGPGQFFSLPDPEFASHSFESAEEPIFRAQSPERSPVDPATPNYGDPILEGSPYRNQFREIPPGWVDIDVNATEGRTGRLMFGAGVNSNAGVVGSFVWDESNFDLFRPPTSFADIIEGRAWRGGGQRFRAEAAPGNQVSRYSVSWTDPYFLYTDFGLSASGFYFNRYYPDWTEDRYGGRVSLSRQFTPEWSAAMALRLEEVAMRDARTPTPAIVTPLLGTSFLSTGRLSVTHDTRDSSMMPTEGHYFDVGYEQAFNDFHFPRLDSEFRQYFTVYNRPDGSGRHVVTVAGSAGWSGDDTPVFERYYAGGFQSFRGFAYRGVTPRIGNFSVGGTFQALGTVEYRVPVTADDMINVVAFTDFGTVDTEVSLENFRATAGFGLRVVIPAMGPVPLAFDFAFPIAKQDFDDDQIFSFYVGINR